MKDLRSGSSQKSEEALLQKERFSLHLNSKSGSLLAFVSELPPTEYLKLTSESLITPSLLHLASTRAFLRDPKVAPPRRPAACRLRQARVFLHSFAA